MKKKDFEKHVLSVYGVIPDKPFDEDFTTEVFRVNGSKKWFAIYMSVPSAKFGLNGGKEDVVNLKCPPELSADFIDNVSVFPAYHMNKTHWVSVLLSRADAEKIKLLTDISYNAVSKTK